MQRIPVLLTVAVLVVAVAACSGGKSGNSTAASSPGASPAPSSAAAGAMSNAAHTMASGANAAGNAMKGAAAGAAGAAAGAAGAAAKGMKGAAVAVVSGNGAKVFVTNCSSCHQANGKGQPGVFPPLAGNALVVGPSDKVIHIVKDGLSGKVMVGTATYNGQMPAWKGTLTDADIADVINYIRSSWGNHAAGTVTVTQVTAAK
jgi:mono/diheme cytochrome c family protein